MGRFDPWTERVRSLHGLCVVAEGEMPGGGAATSIMTLGYDRRCHRYVGTWVGSMMTHLWDYEAKLAGYQDIITIQDDDHRTLTARVQTADGRGSRSCRPSTGAGGSAALEGRDAAALDASLRCHLENAWRRVATVLSIEGEVSKTARWPHARCASQALFATRRRIEQPAWRATPCSRSAPELSRAVSPPRPGRAASGASFR